MNTNRKGVVVSVNISQKKGEQKHPVDKITLQVDHGIVGDAHAGSWHRQISLLAVERVDPMRAKSPIELTEGIFAENINTKGLDLSALPVGTLLAIGECRIEVTQIGKACHHACAIRQAVGDCIMPREGIFAIVVKGGTVKAGDPIEVIHPAEGDSLN